MTAVSESDQSVIVSEDSTQGLGGQSIAWLAIILFLLANVALMLLRLVNKPFNADELQHAHIAWTIAKGEILYSDFWEHHGPFYSLLNGALLFLADPAPTMRILFASRVVSLVATLGVLALTWRIARQLALARFTSLVAVAALAALFFLQNKGIEMRPDVLQSLFWIGGFYLLLRNQHAGSLLQAAGGGALFTLAILCNAKAGIGPFFVVVYYCLAPFTLGMSARVWWRDMLGMAAGFAASMLPFVVYFYANDSLWDFLYYNYLFTVQLAYYWLVGEQSAYVGVDEPGLALEYAVFFLRHQLPFVVLTLIGIWLWRSRLAASSGRARRANALFLIAALGTTTGWLANLFSQFFLIFLPLLSVFAAVGLEYCVVWAKHRFGAVANAAIGVAVATAAVAMLWYPVANAPLARTGQLTSQIRFTNYVVGLLDRDEPVGLIWSTCGGYMFNRNIGFYWVAMPGASNIIAQLSGEHPFGPAFIEQMEAQQVRYVIGRRDWMTEGLTDEALNYLRVNFSYENCLWTRSD